MQTLAAWHRPRHYYIYPEKRAHYSKWFYLALALLFVYFAVKCVRVAYAYRPVANNQQFIETPAESVKVSEINHTSPSVAPLIINYEGLAQSVQAWVNKQTKSQWGIIVQDLDNPANKVAINANKSFRSASLYKLFLTIPLVQKLPFGSWQSQHMTDGESDHTYAACVQAMLAQSDNPCGEAVGNYLGWSKATQSVQAAGFKGTVLGDTPTTTADDVAKYLEELSHGQRFTPDVGSFVLDSLAKQKYRSGIPKGCPDCSVWNKTGNLDGIANDAAIVTHGNSHYVVVILSKNGTFGQIADLSKLISGQLQ